MTKFKAIALNIIFVVVIAILIVANVLANLWSGALTLALGSIGGYNPEGTQYFTSEFEKDEDLISAQEHFLSMSSKRAPFCSKTTAKRFPSPKTSGISAYSASTSASGCATVPVHPASRSTRTMPTKPSWHP